MSAKNKTAKAAPKRPVKAAAPDTVPLTVHQQALAKIEQLERQLAQGPGKPPEESPRSDEVDAVKPHLRCPCCWTGYGGSAARRKWQRQVSGVMRRRCYECGECGAEWTVVVRDDVEDGVLRQTTKIVEIRMREQVGPPLAAGSDLPVCIEEIVIEDVEIVMTQIAGENGSIAVEETIERDRSVEVTL